MGTPHRLRRVRLRPSHSISPPAHSITTLPLAPGQTLLDLESDAWVSSQELLIAYSGTQNHVWENATFEYTTWAQPNSPDG